jgi:Spy/CpxP family protein refolding chaperone
MRHIAIIVGIGAVLLGAGPTWAFHEEAGRAVGEVVDQFRGITSSLERHLGGGPGSMGPDGPALSAAERPLISFMLDHRDELGLNPDQTSRLETLRQSFSRDAVKRDADIRIAEMDLSALLDKDPLDMAKVEAKIRELSQLRTELRIARLKTIEQGKAVLTAEQRTKLQSLLGTPRAARRSAATRL